MPVITVDESGGVLQSISFSFKLHNGTEFVDVPADLVRGLIGSARLAVGSEENSECPGEELRLEGFDGTTWTPTASYSMSDAGAPPACRLRSVFFSYFSMGTLFQFTWEN